MHLLYSLRGAVWILVYLLFILAPLFALLAGSHPPARDFWTEFSVALGYSGLAMMGLQFGLTARFRYVTEPWGEDVIYHFHRQISLSRSAWSWRIRSFCSPSNRNCSRRPICLMRRSVPTSPSCRSSR